MTMPNGADGLSGNIDLAFALSSDGSIPGRIDLDRPTVEELLKQRVRESAGWLGAHGAAFDGLLGGPMALVQNIIVTVFHTLTGMIATGWDNLVDILEHVSDGITTFIATLIPGLDASNIISGQFPMAMIEGLLEFLEDVPVLGDIIKALTGKSDGVLDDIAQWVQNLLSGDWLNGFVKALTGNNSVGHWLSDIEDWAGGLFHSGGGGPVIRPEHIKGLREFMSVVPVSNIGQPTTSANMLSNPAFTTPANVEEGGDFQWQGPKVFVFTVSGTFETSTAGHSAQVGRGVDSDLLEWVPVAYSAKLMPMINSINDGRAKLKSAIASTPAGSKIVLVGTSQGAIVTSKVWEDEILDAGGDLHSRVDDVVAAVAFGNPRRKAGSHAPGTPDPGGTGVIPDDLMAATPSWWYDYTDPNDIVGSIQSGAAGDWAALVADFITNDWTDLTEDLVAVVTSTFGNPFGAASSLVAAVNQLGTAAWGALTGHNPHGSYNTSKIDGTSTAVQLAIEYLNGVGATYAPTEGVDYEDHSDVGSGSIVTTADGTLKEYLHPDLISVTEAQSVTLSAWVKTASWTATGTPIKLHVVTYDEDETVVATVDLDSKASAASWTQLTGSYDIPDGSGVTGVRLKVSLGTTATAGTLKVDDLSLTKTGLLQESHVSGLPTNITNLFGGISDIIQNSVSGLTGAIGEGFSWLVGDLFDASNAVRASLTQIAAAVAALQQAASPEAGGGLAYVLDYSTVSSGSLPANHSITYSGSGTRSLSIAGDEVQLASGNNNTRRADVIISDKVTLTDTQKVSIVLGSTSNYFDGGFPNYGHWEGYDYIYARSDSSGDNRIWASIGDGAVRLGYRVGGGSDVQWAIASHAAAAGAIYSLECGTSGGSRIYRLLKNGNAILTHSEVGTTSMLGASYRYGGYGLRCEGDNSYNFATAGNVAAFALQDNVLPAYTGTGFRAYRASTSATGAVTNSVCGNLLDTVDFVTNDLTWAAYQPQVITATHTGSPTGGTTRWSFTAYGGGAFSAGNTFAYNGSAATLQSRINDSSALGSTPWSATVTGANGGPYTITLTNSAGASANGLLPTVSVNSLTGGTSPNVSFTETTAGAGQKLTVTRTGWYLVTLSLYNNAGGVRPSLYKNGSLMWSQGSTVSATNTSGATFPIYLNAGDYIQAGVDGSGVTLRGDAAGKYCHMEVVKLN